MKRTPPSPGPRPNPVAKYANQFNKARTHRDKKHDYQRTPKHRPRDFGVSFGRISVNRQVA